MTRTAHLNVVPVDGSYRIQKDGRRRGRSHGSYSEAEAEALRLTVDNPGDTFIISREVARVHHKDRR